MRYLVALGANLPSVWGAPEETLREATRRIAVLGEVAADAGIFETPAFPPGSGPAYANGALALESALSPQALLDGLHRIEAEAGRVRGVRWGARTLDLDLIAAGDTILPDRATVERWMALGPDEAARRLPDRLILPHPRLHERAFVLVPLAKVAPGWVHPILGQDVATLLGRLAPEERASIRDWP
ncbi:MAG: 2-amino-4-hydroxy-6-hydroxymethyldihydropteridine diphosphokinase [Rubricella sp.]